LSSSPVIHNLTTSNNYGTNGVALDKGTLAADTTWNNTEVVYSLTGTVVVPAGVTLTIAPGQIIKARFFGDAITVQGTLLSQGTAARPIIFTSMSDDSAGGDTNNDGPSGGPGYGQWQGLQFTSTSTGSVLDHVEVRDGSGAEPDIQAMVEVNGGELTMRNSLL